MFETHEEWLTLIDTLRSSPLAPYLAGPYLLVAMRFWGLFQTVPLFSSPVVSWQIRIVVAVSLGAVAAPFVDGTSTFARLGASETGLASLVELATAGAAEGLLGATLGLGIRLIFGGLQLAGSMIDQQAGLAMSQVLNPISEEADSVTGHLLLLLGGAVLLLMAPVGGDLLLIRSVLESFDRLPIGSPLSLEAPVAFLQDVVLQSFLLSLQVAAPILAAMSLLTLALSYVARSSGQASLPAVFVPLRIVLSLAFLIVVLPGVAERTGDVVAGVVEAGPWDSHASTVDVESPARSEDMNRVQTSQPIY